MKTIKYIILLALLVGSFSSQADGSIEDKLTCAADIIILNSMFSDKDNPGLTPQKERIYVWSNAIIKKLVESGETPRDAENILKGAVKDSRERFVVASTSSEKFNTKVSQIMKQCVNKYSTKKEK
jgi:hypothetical protein